MCNFWYMCVTVCLCARYNLSVSAFSVAPSLRLSLLRLSLRLLMSDCERLTVAVGAAVILMVDVADL